MKNLIPIILLFSCLFCIPRASIGQSPDLCSQFRFEICKTDPPVGNLPGTAYITGPFRFRFPFGSIRVYVGNNDSLPIPVSYGTALFDENRIGFSVGNLPPGTHRIIVESPLIGPCRDTVFATIGERIPFFKGFVAAKLNPTDESSQNGKLLLEVGNFWRGNSRFLSMTERQFYPVVSYSKNGGPFFSPPPFAPGSPRNIASFQSSLNTLSNVNCTQTGQYYQMVLCDLGPGHYRIAVRSAFDTTLTDTVAYTLTTNPCADFQFSISSVSPDVRPKTHLSTNFGNGFGRVTFQSAFVPNQAINSFVYHKIYKTLGGEALNSANILSRMEEKDVYNPSVNPAEVWSNPTTQITPNEPGDYIVLLSSQTNHEGCLDTLRFTVPDYPCTFQVDSVASTPASGNGSEDGSIVLKAKDDFIFRSLLRIGAQPSNFRVVEFCNGQFICPSINPIDPSPPQFCDLPQRNFQKICYLPNGLYKVVVAYYYDLSCLDTLTVQVGEIPVDTVSRPTASLATGTYSGNQTITLSTSTPGAEIYYTTTGNLPRFDVANGFTRLYTGPILISQSTTLRAVSKRGTELSPVITRTYTITDPQVVQNPTFSLSPGTYSGIQSLSLSTPTPGAAVYYTTNGNVPRLDVPNSFTVLYTGPLVLDRTMTIRAVATLPGFLNSGVSLGNYIINDVGTVAAPVFSPGPGGYAAPQNVSLSTTTPGAQILFTTNGMTPRPGLFAARLYSTPLNLAFSTQIKARAFLAGAISSAVSVGNYSIGAFRQSVDGEESDDFFFENEADGIEEKGIEWIRIHPNPSATGLFSVDLGLEKASQIRVFSATGQKMETTLRRKSDSLWEVQLEKAASGLYFLEVNTEKGIRRFPLLK